MWQQEQPKVNDERQEVSQNVWEIGRDSFWFGFRINIGKKRKI